MSPLLTPGIGPRDHLLGDPAAPMLLVEYGDFECDHCGEAYAHVKRVRAELGDSLAFAYRHFPLSRAHPYAATAAEAAEVAGMLGDFWGMHDLLFENQDRLDFRHLRLYAHELGLDLAAFDELMARETGQEKVRADFSSGVRSGVNATPTFFINGVRHDGRYEARALLTAIERVAYLT